MFLILEYSDWVTGSSIVGRHILFFGGIRLRIFYLYYFFYMDHIFGDSDEIDF